MLGKYAGWFRMAAIVEAVSWIGLLISMVFKYAWDIPQGVTAFGWIHGAVFTAYIVICLTVFSPLRWKFWVLVGALAASVPPLATVWFERWALRRGLLAEPDSDEPTFWGRVGHVLRTLN